MSGKYTLKNIVLYIYTINRPQNHDFPKGNAKSGVVVWAQVRRV